MAGLFKLAVHNLLHVLPDGKTIGAQNGKPFYRGILDQLRLAADVRIPLGKIGFHIGNLFDFFLFRHDALRSSFADVPSAPGFLHISRKLQQCRTLLFYAPCTCLSRHKTKNFLDLIGPNSYNIRALL